MGDLSPNKAVCTDIIIRALRHAKIDLQALIHEDVLIHPERFCGMIRQPDFNIDHRRTRNLRTYFTHHFMTLSDKIDSHTRRQFRPGDIVLLDTGIQNGTIYDHIGIIDDELDEDGFPRVINIWTNGFKTSSMDLLGNDYPTIVGHFRATQLFDYQ